MMQNPAKRRFSMWLIAGLLCLSCAVFAWGLQYKLSLYRSASGPTDLPAAKLLTGSDKFSLQRTVMHEAEGPTRGHTFLLVVSLLAFLSLRPAASYRALQYKRIQEASPQRGQITQQRPFFFRPPPVHLH
jgi:hypothetical protein